MPKTSPVSLLASLKRKVMYQVYSLVNDPNADAFAEDDAAAPDDPDGKESTISSLFSVPKTETNTPTEDLIAFTSNESTNRILNRVYGIMKQCIAPFICLLLAMYVANDMIVYSIPIRVIFFVFTYAVCFLFRPFMILLVMFYAGKMMYHLYLNKLSAGAPRRMLPKIFAILPITTTKPVSALMTFLMYPFTYPKSEKDEEKLKVIMKEYMDSLTDTFPYFETVKSVPVFAEGWKQIQEWSTHLHDVPQEEAPVLGENETAVLGKNEAPMPPVLVKNAVPVLGKNETPVLVKNETPVLGKNETPVLGKNEAPVLGKNEAPVLGKNEAPVLGKNAAPVLGKNATPVLGKNEAPVLGKNETPVLGKNETAVLNTLEPTENQVPPVLRAKQALPPSLSQQAPEESKETTST